MSDDVVGQGQATQQTDGHAATEIAEFFTRESSGGIQPRLRSVTGTARFDLAGAGSWLVHVKNGAITTTRDITDASPSDCVVACTAEDFLRIVHREGYLNVFAALLQGLVTVTGDLGFATTLLGGVTRDTVGSAARA